MSAYDFRPGARNANTNAEAGIPQFRPSQGESAPGPFHP